jgi:hypothetical protein
VRKAIPKRTLPSSDDSMVPTNRAVPVDAIVLVCGRIGHHNSLAVLVVRPASAANSGRIIEMRSRIYNDTGKVFRQEPCSRGHFGKRTGRSEIVAQIDDPTINHDGELRPLAQ